MVKRKSKIEKKKQAETRQRKAETGTNTRLKNDFKKRKRVQGLERKQDSDMFKKISDGQEGKTIIERLDDTTGTKYDFEGAR